MNHHPDIDIRWNKVTLVLSTHSEGGLTNNDFELAHRINEVAGQEASVDVGRGRSRRRVVRLTNRGRTGLHEALGVPLNWDS